MLKNTRPFVALGATGKNITLTTEDIPDAQIVTFNSELILTPGDPLATYNAPEVLPNIFEFRSSSMNILTLGVSSSIGAFLTSSESIYTLENVYNNGYTIDYVSGNSLSILIGIACEKAQELPAEYNLEKLVVAGVNPTITQVSGSLSATLGAGYFKSWRLTFNPKDVIQDFSIGFSTSSDTTYNFKNITIKSIAKDTIKKSTSLLGYLPSDITTIHINKFANPFPYLWQSKLADLSYKTITASAGICPVLLGPLAVGASITSSFVFRNTLATAIQITSVSALVTTLQLANVKVGLTRDQVANDFSVEVVSKGTINTFSGAALLKDLPVVVTLLTLDELEIKVTYSPKLRVIANSAMLATYNAATAPSVAASINSNRKIQISIKSSGVAIGAVLELKGSVVL